MRVDVQERSHEILITEGSLEQFPRLFDLYMLHSMRTQPSVNLPLLLFLLLLLPLLLLLIPLLFLLLLLCISIRDHN